MSTGEAGKSAEGTPRTPNGVLRGIRENERHESQREFAESMARVAWETGVEVYPDWKYVQRLESGFIRWPHRVYRNILENLCGRPARELGFAPSRRSARDSAEASSRVNVMLREAIWQSRIEPSEFARKIEVDPKTVERWITRGRIPQPVHRWKASLILGIDESELWPDALPYQETSPRASKRADSRKSATVSMPASSPSNSSIAFENTDAFKDLWEIGYDSSEELMRRRAFLISAAAAAGLGAADTSAAIEAIRQELNLSLVEERAGTQIDEWQEIALDYGESYPTTAPAVLARALTVDMLGIQVALRRHSDTAQQRDLLRVASLLSAFTAQTVANMGQPLMARRWWRTARNAADRSGDPYSALWVRGREIVRAMENRPVPAILQLIEEAEGITAQAPPEATLELIAAKAQTLALAGRKHAANETLIKLRRQFSKSPSGYSGSMLSWGQERLHNTESFTYSRLGILSDAESATVNGLSLYAANSPTNVRHPAQLQLNLAFALVRSGDVSEGLKYARDVISGLPEAHRAMRIDDGYKLLGMVPIAERRRADFQEYREWINSLIGSAGSASARL